MCARHGGQLGGESPLQVWHARVRSASIRKRRERGSATELLEQILEIDNYLALKPTRYR